MHGRRWGEKFLGDMSVTHDDDTGSSAMDCVHTLLTMRKMMMKCGATTRYPSVRDRVLDVVVLRQQKNVRIR